MSTHSFKAHVVDAQHIVGIAPLTIGGRMLGPDQGVVLVFEDGTKKSFIGNGREPIPEAGDWLVTDAALSMTYAVSSTKFPELFGE
jgi:hypothetical protein